MATGRKVRRRTLCGWLQLKYHRFEDVRPILSCRETLSSVMSTNERLRESMRLSIAHTRKAEYNALIFSSKIYRKHGALQDSLASATYLTDIAKESSQTGLNMEAAATTEIASVLWDQGETTTAINMLKELTTDSRLESQMSELDRSVCLATLVSGICSSSCFGIVLNQVGSTHWGCAP